MKTICFFNSTKAWGGGEKWHFDIALELHKNNFPVLVVVRNQSALHQRLQKTSVPVETIKVENLSYLNPLKVSNAAKLFEKHELSAIIMNSSEDMKFAGLAAKKAGIKHIIYRRGSAIPIKNTFINRYFFGNVLTSILANSHATKKTIVQNNAHMFPLEKITVIPNGIETKTFLETPFKPIYSKTDSDEFVIGNLGRLVYQKNQSFLIDVAKELKNRQFNFKLVIGGSGKLLKELQEKTQKLDVADKVVFAGFIKNPKDLFSSIDVFMLSSFWEGFGYVIAESMLCEKPVVAFDVSSNPELVKDSINGYLTKENDVNAVCDKIISLKENPKTYEDFSKNGKQMIVEEFDIRITVNRVKDYLVSLINEK
ncbi:glycosyltransferase [Aureivirga marina]|uniref:glycosyltransferase n=1 Tax=Aureivirga marina TaxID=1182451 RepID=UPI0018CA9926|nr:glycosyltransferase [Aureivirga marina]